MKSFASSTREIPPPSDIPRHIAVIMDGNGRWAKKRYLPRVAGHKQGVETVRRVTRACTDRGIEYLTLFAFSSENWRRPAEEVSTLKQLFMAALEQEAERLHQNKAEEHTSELQSHHDLVCRLLLEKKKKKKKNKLHRNKI